MQPDGMTQSISAFNFGPEEPASATIAFSHSLSPPSSCTHLPNPSIAALHTGSAAQASSYWQQALEMHAMHASPSTGTHVTSLPASEPLDPEAPPPPAEPPAPAAASAAPGEPLSSDELQACAPTTNPAMAVHTMMYHMMLRLFSAPMLGAVRRSYAQPGTVPQGRGHALAARINETFQDLRSSTYAVSTSRLTTTAADQKPASGTQATRSRAGSP